MNPGKGLARTGGPKRTSWSIGPCRFGRWYATELAAGRSKRGLLPGAEVSRCWSCKGWHVKAAPVVVLSPDAPVKPMRRRDTGPSMKVRLQVYKRDGYMCQCGCGISVIGKPHSVGHRKRRSQGGSHTPENLLTFLGWGNGLTGDEDHHRRVDMRVNPDDEARGLTVRSHQDPALIPVQFRREDGSLLLQWPTADGKYLDEAPGKSVAA